MAKYEIRTEGDQCNLQALRIAADISALTVANDEEVVFDFRKYDENNPFSNLLIANTLRNYKKQHQNPCRLHPHKNTYLDHLGFYQMIGAQHGKRLGEAKASDNYVPITRIDFGDDPHVTYKAIVDKSKELAALLKFDSQLSECLVYLFKETLRNSYEHAEIGDVYLAAQKWRSKSLLEIAISDTGCGICNSLRNWSPYSTKSEEELIRLSCEPGVSARSNFGYLDKSDGWRNSGYGLYCLRKLAIAYGGSFLLCSGKYAFFENKHANRIYRTEYQGTTIAIRIRTDVNCNFGKELTKICDIGEKQSSRIPNSIRSASLSSNGCL